MAAEAGLSVRLAGAHALVQGGARAQRLRLGMLLRAEFGATIRTVGAGYRIPHSALLRVHDVIGEGADWDEAARAVLDDLRLRRDAQLEAARAFAMGHFVGDDELTRLNLGLELAPHQRQAALAIANTTEGVAIFDEQGTGKTLAAIAGFALLRARGTVARALVIAPKSVLSAWRDEAHRLLGADLRVAVAVGSARQRRATIRSDHAILVTNYEALVSDEAVIVLRLHAARSRYLLVIDESFMVKNPSRIRSQAIARVREECARAVVLSGTPAPNEPWDVVNQVAIADRGAAFGPARKPTDRKAARDAVVAGLARTPFLRRLKVQVAPDLPPQDFIELRVPMAERQRHLYEHAARTLALEVRTITDTVFRRDLASYVARRAALLQICSHPGAIDPTYDEVPAKLRFLDAFLKERIVVRGQKVVIWSWFRHSLSALADRFADYGLARIDGSVADADEREDAIKRFQKDPTTRLFIGNPAAAGAGITLTAARTAVYESLSNQAVHYMQSLDRIHRIGQRSSVEYVALLCDATVEIAEFERLKDKQRDSRELLADAWTEPESRLLFLREIEAGLSPRT
jgi:SNF2 family DNA or RNA helicase